MTSWRVLGLRIASLCALLSIACWTRPAAAQPDLPALLDSFDRAFALVYDAAERQVAELEAARPPALLIPDVFTLLDAYAGCVAQACDTAATALDLELVLAASLSPERRYATLSCLERHLREARRDAARAADPAVRAEYEATCDRLRNVRQMI
ncbi:MAG TPA: hypothetical protein VHT91_45950 [Kofleriaceae bacterium]|jgi:hypothetical protein|nr:hypothetical protein [Kofleriaceae bacterium]